jgi:hypothetical protein
MKVLEQDKKQIRRMLLLELNSAFVKVTRELKAHANEDQMAFLQELIESVRECVTGKIEDD